MQQNYVNGNVSQMSLIPSIKAGQFNADQEKIPGCVNLFRGDLNFPLKLLDLPGKDGLNAAVNLMYFSHDEYELYKPNSERGTGILGAGWEMPYSRIVADYGESYSPECADFYLCEGTSVNKLLYRGTDKADGGVRIYELENYQPWSIRYDLKNEVWDIIKENGTLWSFGGKSPDAGASPYILWGIKWGGKNGNWQGITTDNTTQSQFIRGWNLAYQRSPLGAQIKYSYEPVNAAVGSGSAVYTRETYLKSMEAAGNIRVGFVYGEKNPDEYSIPHKPPSIASPNVCQDLYETKYLKNILLTYGDEDAAFCRYDFIYRTLCMADSGERDKSAYNKRFLCGIEQKNESGASVSKYSFEYAESGDGKGLLNKVVYPDCRVMSVKYKNNTLRGAALDYYIGADSMCGCWISGSYSVTASKNGKIARVEVSGFSGSWSKYTAEIVFTETIGEIEVRPEPDFFTLVISGKTSASLYIFNEEKGRRGRWSYTNIAAGLDGSRLRVAASRNFAAYCQDDSSELYIATRSSRTETWEKKQYYISERGVYTLTAGTENIFLSSYDRSGGTLRFILYSYNGTDGAWSFKNANRSPVRAAADDKNKPLVQVSMTGHYAAAAYVTEISESRLKYSVCVYRWDSVYNVYEDLKKEYNIADGNPKKPYLSLFADNSMLVNTEHMFRYTGSGWANGELPVLSETGGELFFGGKDGFGAVWKDSDCSIKKYNPYRNIFENVDLGGKPQRLNYGVTFGNGCFTAGDGIYFETPEGGIKKDPARLPDNVSAGGMINCAPNYIACETADGKTFVYLFENRRVSEVKILNGKLYLGGSGRHGYFASPSAFATYVPDRQGKVTGVTVHRVLNKEVGGRMNDIVVESVAVNDGYEEHICGYEYNSDDVVVSSNGMVTGYSKAAALPGGGRVEFEFYNGLSARQFGENHYYYSALQGNIYKKTVCGESGGALMCEKSFYSVKNSRERLSGGGETPLCGLIIQIGREEKEEFSPFGGEPLTTVKTYEYDGVTGLLKSESCADFGSGGNAESESTEYYPAWRYYSGIREKNCLMDRMLVKKTLNGTPYAIELTEYVPHNGVWCAQNTYKALNENASIANWEDKDLRDGYWFESSGVLARSEMGAPSETRAAGEGVSHILTDAGELRRTAEFRNASKEDSFCSGFAAYEKRSVWIFENAYVCTDDFYTGEAGAVIRAGGKIKYAAPLKLRRRQYILSGFAKNIRNLTAYMTSAGNKTLLKPEYDEAEGWTYWHTAVEGADGEEVSFEFRNESEGGLLLDFICFAPKLSGWKAAAYNRKTGEQTEEITQGGRIERYFYNGRYECIGKTSLDGYVSDLSLNFRGEGGEFSKDTRGMIEARFQGVCREFRFRDKNDILRDWTVSGGCAVENRALVFPEGGTLTRKAGADSGDICVFAEMTGAEAGFEIRCGQNVRAGWSPEDGSYYLNGGGAEYRISGSFSPEFAVFASCGSVLVYGGGKCVFSKKISGISPAPDDISVSAGRNMGISRIFIGENPSLTVMYKDGYNRQRQTHRQHDDMWIADEIAYDAVYRISAVTVKEERDAPPDGYDARFLPEMLERNDYPYYKFKYENFISERITEKSLPGENYSMDSANGKAHTVKYRFGKDGADQDICPETAYYVTETTDTEGAETIEVTNRRGQLLLKRSDGEIRYEYDAAGNPVKIHLPEKQTASMEYDFSGNKILSHEPDFGITKYMYDRAGRLRFYASAEDSANGRACYNKYDALGRLSETGVISEPFSDSLERQAKNNPDYPSEGCWNCRYLYDGDGKDADLSGRLHTVLTKTADGKINKESFRYDRNGNVTRKTAFNGMTAAYEYANYKNLSKITYPGGGLEISYKYNSRGQVSAMSAPGQCGLNVRYSYDKNGKLKRRVMPEIKLEREYRHNEQGGLTGIYDVNRDGIFFTQELRYEKTKDGKKGRRDGYIAEYDSGSRSITSEKYGYSAGKQLIRTENGQICEYQYDKNGSMLTRAGKENLRYTYEKGTNRAINISGDRSADVAYNLSGQVTGASHLGITSIKYNPVSGQPEEINRNGETVYMEYDGMGRKITQSAPGSERAYIRGADTKILADMENGDRAKEYIYGPDGMIAFTEKGKLYFIIRDYQYSARIMTDEKGGVLREWRYGQFGAAAENLSAEGAPELRYLYTEQEWNPETELYSFPARLYDPVLAVFYTPDKQRQYPNPYLYCNNNPVNLIDSDGNFAFLAALLIGAAVGLALGAGVAAYKGYSAGLRGWDLFGYISLGGAIGAVGGALTAVSGAACFGIGAAVASAGFSTAVTVGVSMAAGAVLGAGIQIAKNVSEYYVNDMFGVENEKSLEETIVSGAITGAVSGAVLGGAAGYGGALAAETAKAWNHDISNLKAISEAYTTFSDMSAFDISDWVGVSIAKFISHGKIISGISAAASSGAGYLYGLIV